jgi:hypothetical protein
MSEASTGGLTGGTRARKGFADAGSDDVDIGGGRLGGETIVFRERRARIRFGGAFGLSIGPHE